MPAAETQRQVVTYAPRAAASAPAPRDLLLVEQERWGSYCGLLTRIRLARYLRSLYSREQASAEELADQNWVDCCGYGGDLAIPIYVYALAEGVSYQLRATAGNLGEGVLETIVERESVTFALESAATIRHPAAEIVSARWLTGPWTTGGASIAAPSLSVSGQTVRSPVPVFGSVELTLRARRWRHILTIPKEEAENLLINGWAEFVVALPSGGRPVGQEITEPPGAAELARTGEECGRGRGGGDSGTIEGPEDDEPTAQGEDKRIKCDYCELTCEDPDEKSED